jgi:hypothetical protein
MGFNGDTNAAELILIRISKVRWELCFHCSRKEMANAPGAFPASADNPSDSSDNNPYSLPRGALTQRARVVCLFRKHAIPAVRQYLPGKCDFEENARECLSDVTHASPVSKPHGADRTALQNSAAAIRSDSVANSIRVHYPKHLFRFSKRSSKNFGERECLVPVDSSSYPGLSAGMSRLHSITVLLDSIALTNILQPFRVPAAPGSVQSCAESSIRKKALNRMSLIG